MSIKQQRILVMLAIAGASVVTVAADPPTSTSRPNTSVATKTGYAPINGLEMYYEIRGEGKPAVYIHPILSHCGLTPDLTRNRRWIVMDLQGHGRTRDIDRPMTCEQHADDVAALLKYLKIEQADVFGDSFGGSIAAMVAVRHPELVRRVVCYGSPLTPFPKDLASVITPDSDVVKWEREEYEKVAPERQHWPTLFAKVLQCGIGWKGLSLDELKAIKVPVLIACGDHDLIPVERCAELAQSIPHAQLAVLPDASHFVLFSEPGRLLPTIATFFDAPEDKPPLATFKSGYYPGATG